MSFSRAITFSDSHKLQIVASRGNIMGESADGGAAGTLGAICRIDAAAGRSDITGVRLVFTNFKVPAAAAETDGANDIVVQAAVELDSPAVVVPVRFNGSKTVTIPAGAGYVISDPVGLDIPAGTTFHVRTYVTVPSASFWPKGNFMRKTGERAREFTADNSSQTYAAGLPTGGTLVSYGYCPIAILGRFKSPEISIAWLGDSKSVGTGDTGNLGGYNGRALSNIGGSEIAWSLLARSSDAAVFNTVDQAPRKRAILEHASHVFVDIGINDIKGGAALGVVQGYLTDIYTGARRYGAKVYGCTLTPYTTGSWGSAGAQTYGTGCSPGGVRDQINTWIKGGAGGLLDGFSDVGSVPEDQANLCKWIANYTTDGIHPSATAHAAMATVLAATVATLS